MRTTLNRGAIKVLVFAVPVLGLLLALAHPAGAAVTIGSYDIPPMGQVANCSLTGGTYVQVSSSSDIPSYTVPAGGGDITSWSTFQGASSGGSVLALLLVSPSGTIDAVDSHVLPNPIPANNVVTFTPTQPIVAPAGDRLGLYGDANAGCQYVSAGLALSDTTKYAAGAPPAVGSMPSFSPTSSGFSKLDVAATLGAPVEDAAVTASVAPQSIAAGAQANFTLTVTNNGSSSGAITLTAVVPPGLGIVSVAIPAASGSCTVAGVVVTCNLPNLPPPQSAAVTITVLGRAPGNFTATASVTPAATDPNTQNNSASATLGVTAPPPQITTSGRASTTSRGSSVIVNTGQQVKCPAGGASCSVNLLAQTSGAAATAAKAQKKAKAITVGQTTLTVQPGKKATLTFKLNKRGVKLLAKAKNKHLTIKLTTTARAGTDTPVTTTKTITIKQPKAKKKKRR